MDYTFTYPREKFEAGQLTSTEIKKLIGKHESLMVDELTKKDAYYKGEHEIQNRTREAGAPNEKAVCNHAKDISDTASGYFMGNPITWIYKGEAEDGAQPLYELMDYAEVNDTDQENALILSIQGRGYEYIYLEEGEPMLKTKSLDPKNTFMVCDQSIEHRELFGVYYYYKKDDTSDKEETKCYITVSTAEKLMEYVLESNEDVPPVNETENVLGFIQIIEYKNNKFCIGDFEQQIGLIDAYNTLMSDRVNDKEQFVDNILVLYGAILGDNAEETAEAQKQLKQRKLLELDEDARAEYLKNTLDETGAEVLRQALKQDIYTFSHVPNLSDENFAGNSSGVAMEYKLLGLEMLTKIKERWYRRGLRKRLKIFLRVLEIKGVVIPEAEVEAKFSRGLPKNNLEIAQIVATLAGTVSQRTLLSQIPFVENPDAEIEALDAEREKNMLNQMQMMTAQSMLPPDDEGGEPEEEEEEIDEQ